MVNEERVFELLQSIPNDIEYGEVLYDEEMFKEFKKDVKELYELIKDLKSIDCN